MMARSTNAGTEEAEAGGSLGVPVQPGLLSELFLRKIPIKRKKNSCAPECGRVTVLA